MDFLLLVQDDQAAGTAPLGTADQWIQNECLGKYKSS